MIPKVNKLSIAGMFIAGSLIYLLCLAYLQPSFSDAQYRLIDETNVNGVDIVKGYPALEFESNKLSELPFRFGNQNSLYEVSMKMHARAIHPRTFSILADDCLLEIDINAEEQEIVDKSCSYPFPHNIKFSNNFHEGENFVVVIGKNNGGKGAVYINASYKDPIIFSVHIFYTLFLSLIAYLIAIKIRNKENKILFGIVFAGALLRCAYLIGTPFLVREYDAFGHFQYIQYVHQHWLSIPPANSGWEYSQPPFYYWLASLFSLPAKIYGTEMMVIMHLRIFALILSVSSLVVSVWLAKMLFVKKDSLWKRSTFVSVFAVLPGLVFMTSRVSNDPMVFLLGMLFFAFLWRWWKKDRKNDLYVCFFFLGLCLLTKNNGIALIPVALVAILLKRNISRKLVLKYFVICAMVISLMVGWLYAMRIAQQGEFKVIGNVHMVNKKMQIDIKPSNFTTFKLSEILHKPHNNPWNDSARRRYYWEVLIKSVFTGEFNMGERVHSTARVIHTVNFVLLLIVVLAFAKDILLSVRKNVPLWALLIFLIMAQIGIVSKERFNGLQKFRYVTLLAIPVTYYFVAGLSMLNPIFRRLILWLFWVFIVLCVIHIFFVIASN